MDPNPFKHPAIILARIHEAIEPSLAAAGFKFDGRNKPPAPVYLFIDYSRGNDLFRLTWDRRDSDRFIGFVAELIHEPDNIESITSGDLSYIGKLPRDARNAEIQTTVDTFADSVRKCLDGLGGQAK